MDIEFSSCVVNCYKNKLKQYNMHFDSHIMIHTNATFSVSSYLKMINIKTQYESTPIIFDEYSICENDGVKYNGTILTAKYHGKCVTNLLKIVSVPSELEIEYHFSFTGHSTEKPLFMRKSCLIIARS